MKRYEKPTIEVVKLTPSTLMAGSGPGSGDGPFPGVGDNATDNEPTPAARGQHYDVWED